MPKEQPQEPRDRCDCSATSAPRIDLALVASVSRFVERWREPGSALVQDGLASGRVSEIVFRVDGRSQPVSVDDALDIRARLLERTLAADELRAAIGAAIRRAESGERPAVDVAEEMRGELFKGLVGIKDDRGLTPALSELERTLLR